MRLTMRVLEVFAAGVTLKPAVWPRRGGVSVRVCHSVCVTVISCILTLDFTFIFRVSFESSAHCCANAGRSMRPRHEQTRPRRGK